MENVAITFTREELKIIYFQIFARVTTLESLMVDAATKSETNRVLELAGLIGTLQIIMEKLRV